MRNRFFVVLLALAVMLASSVPAATPARAMEEAPDVAPAISGMAISPNPAPAAPGTIVCITATIAGVHTATKLYTPNVGVVEKIGGNQAQYRTCVAAPQAAGRYNYSLFAFNYAENTNSQVWLTVGDTSPTATPTANPTATQPSPTATVTQPAPTVTPAPTATQPPPTPSPTATQPPPTATSTNTPAPTPTPTWGPITHTLPITGQVVSEVAEPTPTPTPAVQVFLPVISNGECVAGAGTDTDWCPNPGNVLPACPDGQLLMAVWPGLPGQIYYQCRELGPTAASPEFAPAVAVAMAPLAITPLGWVVIGAVVVGGSVLVVYGLTEGQWDSFPTDLWDQVEAAGPAWVVDEWYSPHGELGVPLEYVRNEFEAPTPWGGEGGGFMSGEALAKFYVDPTSIVLADSLWTVEEPTQDEAEGAAVLVLVKAADGLIDAFPLFTGDEMPVAWETIERMEPLYALDTMINPPSAPGTTHEGSAVFYPEWPGTPQLKTGGHSAKPGSIHWTIKLAAWNLLWSYVLRGVAAGGNGGDDFDWCGVKKDPVKGGGVTYTYSLIKYDVTLWFRGITTWLQHLGLGAGWQDLPGAILLLNEKRPTAWWGFVKPFSGSTPVAAKMPLPNGSVNQIGQKIIDGFTRIPCDVIDVIRCLTDPAGCIPPGMLPQ